MLQLFAQLSLHISGNMSKWLREKRKQIKMIERKPKDINILKLLDIDFKINVIIMFKKFIPRWKISWIYFKESNVKARAEKLWPKIRNAG